MAEHDTDAARLALAAIAEVDGETPLVDRYREEQALRVATFTDLDLPTARRVVEVAYHSTTLSELLVRVSLAGTRSQVNSVVRRLRDVVQGRPDPGTPDPPDQG
jgi:hypothetical protein